MIRRFVNKKYNSETQHYMHKMLEQIPNGSTFSDNVNQVSTCAIYWQKRDKRQ